jgi:hypothetical protein
MFSQDPSFHPPNVCLMEVDGFFPIGHFHIEVPIFHYALDRTGAEDWVFAIYAWASVLRGGVVMRIGKSEGPLGSRLAAYKRSLDTVMSGVLLPNTYFKGDTQPWEREGWVHYAGGPNAGIILARQLGPLAANETPREALARLESRLSARYDPPLSGVSRSGRQAKRRWEARNGPTYAVSRRASRPANDTLRVLPSAY